MRAVVGREKEEEEESSREGPDIGRRRAGPGR